MRTICFALLCSVLLLCLPCYAQDQGDPEEPDVSAVTNTLTVDALVLQPCIVTLPADYSPEKTYPLVIGLHGYGSSAGRFSTNWFAFDNPRFIYACPRGPYHVQGSDEAYGWVLVNSGLPEAEEASQQYSVKYVADVIAKLKTRYKVSQVFVLGFSQGGMLAYQLGVENAGQIAGIACLAAPLEGSWISGKTLMGAAGLPVLVAGGKEDTDVPLAEVQQARDALAAHSLEVEYFEYEGGHSFDAGVLRRVQEWISTKLVP